MQVKVEDVLPRCPSVGGPHVEPMSVGRSYDGRSEPSTDLEQVAGHMLRARGNVSVVLAWDHERVAGVYRVEIEEANCHIIFVDDAGRQFSFENPAKHAVVHA